MFNIINKRLTQNAPKLAFLLLSIFVSITAAAEITIQDVEGNIRAQGDVAEHGGNVTMTVTDANGLAVADGEIITLTPAAGGEAISATVIGGEAVFVGVTAGVYTVSSTSLVTIASIGISTGAVAATGGAAVAGGSAAVIGGGSAAIVGGTTVAAIAGAGAVGLGTAAVVVNNDSKSNPVSPFR